MPTSLGIVGSPHTPSKTLVATRALARRLDAGATLVDLGADPFPRLLGTYSTTDPAVQDALRRIADAKFLVVGSPIYKGSLTGLLKCFLDVLPPQFLQGKSAVALMVGATERHALAVRYTLLPVLLELGAHVEGDGLFFHEGDIDLERGTLRGAGQELLERCAATLGL